MSVVLVGIAWLGLVGIARFTRLPDWLFRVGFGVVVASGAASVVLAGSAVWQLTARAFAPMALSFRRTRMFGLSKRERYEDEVVVLLHAFFGDIDETKRAEAIVPRLKEVFRDHWKGVLDEGLAKGNSPRLTAFILAVLFYQMALKGLPNEE
jgi:hypothetical protein